MKKGEARVESDDWMIEPPGEDFVRRIGDVVASPEASSLDTVGAGFDAEKGTVASVPDPVLHDGFPGVEEAMEHVAHLVQDEETIAEI